MITAYDGLAEELSIPSELDGITVTAIDRRGFWQAYNLVSVTIPDSITFIGDSTFNGCESLTSVVIPGSVTYIGEKAFYCCSDNLVLTVDRDSYARQYALDNGINFTYPDINDWLNS